MKRLLLSLLAAAAASDEDTHALLQSHKIMSSSDVDAFTSDLEAVVRAVETDGSQDKILNLYRRASQSNSAAFVQKYSKVPVESKKHLIDAGLKSSKVMALLESLSKKDRQTLFLQFAAVNQDLVQDQTLVGKSKGQTEDSCKSKGKNAKSKDAKTAATEAAEPKEPSKREIAKALHKVQATERKTEVAAAKAANEADSSNTFDHRRRGMRRYGRRRGTGRRRGKALTDEEIKEYEDAQAKKAEKAAKKAEAKAKKAEAKAKKAGDGKDADATVDKCVKKKNGGKKATTATTATKAADAATVDAAKAAADKAAAEEKPADEKAAAEEKPADEKAAAGTSD